MTYWHIQMNQPWGRDSGTIDSQEMVFRNDPIIGTGEWNDIQCRHFKGEEPDGVRNDDIVLVHEGKRPIALCKVIGDLFQDPSLEAQFVHKNFRRVEVLVDLRNDPKNFPMSQKTFTRFMNPSKESFIYIDQIYKKYSSMQNVNLIADLLKIKKQLILQGPPGTGKTYTAKDVAEKIIRGSLTAEKNDQALSLENSGQFVLVQFHPSYSYEDFVRGISAKAEGTQIVFEAENKTLIQFASKALENLRISQFERETSAKYQWAKDRLDDFRNEVETQLANDGEYSLTDKGYIYEVGNDCFRYDGDNWKTKGRLNYDDIIALCVHNLNQVQGAGEPLIDKNVSLHAYYRQSYYKVVLSRILQTNDIPDFDNAVQIPRKNFVLVIDEINRANLPSVFGELIYALEYRGQAVDSLYEISGDRKLVLPENLFIIGTMNTADRSVGHIDYAIRRRFAFVDIEPNSSVLDQVIADDAVKQAAKRLFSAMETLFTAQYLSSDFKKSHLMLGHSYFLVRDMDELKLKLDYEIKPLLREYLQDGIFKTLSNPDGSNKVEQMINELGNGIV